MGRDICHSKSCLIHKLCVGYSKLSRLTLSSGKAEQSLICSKGLNLNNTGAMPLEEVWGNVESNWRFLGFQKEIAQISGRKYGRLAVVQPHYGSLSQ